MTQPCIRNEFKMASFLISLGGGETAFMSTAKRGVGRIVIVEPVRIAKGDGEHTSALGFGLLEAFRVDESSASKLHVRGLFPKGISLLGNISYVVKSTAICEQSQEAHYPIKGRAILVPVLQVS
jgi:hypothetical protein